ncbi:deoxynucleoside triphosphate triphosphohydrolase SAMHD1-like isoform X2 [Channa argus]|uniref:deoxynucleoside triphosphate triphosphohydrolase SAMHD1-like isoform X2 n=1 Tax=Channa argus TaxID=215402 RepID=UPI0035219C30
MSEQTSEKKVFNDPIHGHVELHQLLVKIIDTPQFQRLRYIKQLGGAYFVYPGASHNRFEHSIGVAHLAGQLLKALSKEYNENLKGKKNEEILKITATDILCVQIAGLCHDLGHGPFSHMYDGMFIPKARPGTTWKHEEASIKMFDYLVSNNNLEPVMKECGLKLPEDLVFIKQMIGGPLDTAAQDDQLSDGGRQINKSFLYDIVANKKTGIDVDKFDYFARDCHHLGIKNTFDHQRFIMFASVIEEEGEKNICCRDKEVYNLYDMFYTRYSLHKRAYQHKVNIIIQVMIRDAFLKADPFIKVKVSNGRTFTLSTAINDMEAYTQLTDKVFEDILHSSSKDLQEAKEILKRIISRDIYHFLGKSVDEHCKDEKTIETWKRQLAGNSALKQEDFEGLDERTIETWKRELAENCMLKPEDFEILVSTIDYGMKDNDPMTNMHFYNKWNPEKIDDTCKENLSILIPSKFSEHYIMVYCKKTDWKSLKVAKRCFEEWNKN